MSDQQKFDRRDIRRLNSISVLNQLQANGTLSRANIASNLGLTRATVSNIVAELLEAKLVTETEYVEGRAGRPGLLLDFNPQFGCMVAVDMDLDQVVVHLTDAGKTPLWQQEQDLNVDLPPEQILEQVATLVGQALEQGRAHGLDCIGICVAWAGLVDRKEGQLAYGPTSGWDHIPLKASWERRFDVPVFVENGAHAAAIGVHHCGPAKGARNQIYLSLGVGLAAGIFVDGVLLRGTQGFAGQVGHTPFLDNGITCNCGKQGCWATEITANALLRKLSNAGVQLDREGQPGVDWLNQVLERGQQGDPEVMEVLNGIGRQVGRGLARLAQTFNPSMLVVGGRMGGLMKLAEPAIREGLRAYTLPYMADGLVLSISDSGNDNVNGCLATIFDAVMQNPISD